MCRYEFKYFCKLDLLLVVELLMLEAKKHVSGHFIFNSCKIEIQNTAASGRSFEMRISDTGNLI